MIRTILYSVFAFAAALNLVYLALQGFGTAYDQYHIVSLVASYLMLIVMGWHLRVLESDWDGLWPAGISPEFKRYVRIGMRVLGVPVLLGLVALSLLVPYHLISRPHAWVWANHLLYLFYVGVNANFLLLCLLGDRILFSQAAKLKSVSSRTRIAKRTSEIREQIAMLKNAKNSGAKPTKQIKNS